MSGFSSLRHCILCQNTVFSGKMACYTFWHKLHFPNKTVYFTKQFKQNVQFLHAVALLSIHITKIVQRKSTFFTEHTHLLKQNDPGNQNQELNKNQGMGGF